MVLSSVPDTLISPSGWSAGSNAPSSAARYLIVLSPNSVAVETLAADGRAPE
jgi:hypothetical protein